MWLALSQTCDNGRRSSPGSNDTRQYYSYTRLDPNSRVLLRCHTPATDRVRRDILRIHTQVRGNRHRTHIRWICSRPRDLYTPFRLFLPACARGSTPRGSCNCPGRSGAGRQCRRNRQNIDRDQILCRKCLCLSTRRWGEGCCFPPLPLPRQNPWDRSAGSSPRRSIQARRLIQHSTCSCCCECKCLDGCIC